MITLEQITPTTAYIFKAVRLRALKDAPTAFSSTYDKELLIPDEEWFKRSVRWSSEGSVGYLAFFRGESCGMVACYAEDQNPARAHVVSMWVDPRYRRTGAGTALINAVMAWAKARGMQELKLMVTSVNRGAIDFYERIGFTKTGKISPYPNDPLIVEYEMLLPLCP
jgi:ribosomal protein S18 acetylase RimI-like enzyme